MIEETNDQRQANMIIRITEALMGNPFLTFKEKCELLADFVDKIGQQQ